MPQSPLKSTITDHVCYMTAEFRQPTLDIELFLPSEEITFSKIRETLRRLEGRYGFNEAVPGFYLYRHGLDRWKNRLKTFEGAQDVKAQAQSESPFDNYVKLEEGTRPYREIMEGDMALTINDMFSMSSEMGDIRAFSLAYPGGKAVSGVFWLHDDMPALAAEIVRLLHPGSSEDLVKRVRNTAEEMQTLTLQHFKVMYPEETPDNGLNLDR